MECINAEKKNSNKHLKLCIDQKPIKRKNVIKNENIIEIFISLSSL